MAKVRDFTVTEFTTASGTWTPDTMPIHQSGDILIALWGKDSTTGLSTSSGWTEYVDQNSAAANGGVQMIRATSSSETFSATLTTETGVLVIVSVMDAYGSTLADAIDLSPVAQGADSTTIPFTGVTGQSTTNNQCLLFFARFSDSGTSPTAYPPAVNLYAGDAASGSLGVAYSWKETAGSIAEQKWYGRANDDGRAIIFAIRSSGSGARSGYSDPGISSGSVIRPLVGASTMQSDTWPTSLSLTSIGGVGTTYDAAAASADNGTNPYTDATNLTHVASNTLMYASQLNFGTTEDMDTGIILTAYRPAAVRDLAIDPGLPSLDGGGYQLTMRDASDNYLSYTIHAKGANLVSTSTGYVPVAIDWNGSATSWASSGSINKSTVASILMSTRGRYGAVTVVMSMLCLVGKIGIAGGSSSVPLVFDDLDTVLNNCLGIYPLMVRSGSAATFFTPLQFGGGDPLHISINLRTFQFPTRYNTTTKYFQWNASDDVAGVKFYPKSGDTLKFTNCVFTSDSIYRWEFDASSATSGVTMSFSGTSVVNGTVSLRAVATFSDMTFNNCSEIILNGADIADSTIRNSRATTSQGAIAITSASEGDGVDRISFIDNNDGDLGHSIRITATGTYTFDGHSFSGGGVAERNFNTGTGINSGTDVITTDLAHGYSDGDAVYYQDQGGSVNMGLTDGTLYYVNSQSTTTLSFHTTKADAIADTSRVDLTSSGSETHYIYSAKADVYNNSGGAVTINVTNGGDTPTIRNSDVSSTTVNNAVTLSITVVDANNAPVADAQTAIYRSSDDTQLMNEDTATVTAGSFVVGVKYKITSVGTTDFTTIGASSNTVGVVFTSTGIGSGTGTATNGVASEAYNFITNTDIYIRVRKSTTGDTKYYPASTTGTITSSGFSATITLIEDTTA